MAEKATMPFARLLRSRWAALLWAGGIVWFAVDFAQSQSTPVGAASANVVAASNDGASIDQAELERLSNLFTQ